MVLEAHGNVDVSAVATRVLADLEALFDDRIVRDESEDAPDDDLKRAFPWISLDELAVAVNASIHRHQPRAVLPENAAATKQSETERGGAVAPLASREHSVMPFADYQDMLERKTQWFHRNIKGGVRTSASERRRPCEPQYTGKTRSDSSDDSKPSQDESSGDNECDEDSDADWSSQDENNALSPPAPLVARQRNGGNRTQLEEAPVDILLTTGTRATASRDAFTQATLTCDQSQQTSVGNHGSLAPARQRGSSESLAAAAEHSLTYHLFRDGPGLAEVMPSPQPRSFPSASLPSSYARSVASASLSSVPRSLASRSAASSTQSHRSERDAGSPADILRQQSRNKHRSLISSTESARLRQVAPETTTHRLQHTKENSEPAPRASGLLPKTWELDLSNFNLR